jgi:hypothetical protein
LLTSSHYSVYQVVCAKSSKKFLALFHLPFFHNSEFILCLFP